MLNIFDKIYRNWASGHASNTQVREALNAEYVALGREYVSLEDKAERGDARAQMRREWIAGRQVAIINSLNELGGH
jgi:hypothetical protein